MIGSKRKVTNFYSFFFFTFLYLFRTKSRPSLKSQKSRLITPFGGAPELLKSSKYCLMQAWWWFFDGTWSTRPVHRQRSILGNTITLFLLFFCAFYSRINKSRDHERVIIMTIFLTSLTIVGLQRKSTEGQRVCAGSKQWMQLKVCWSGEKKCEILISLNPLHKIHSKN